MMDENKKEKSTDNKMGAVETKKKIIGAGRWAARY